MPQAGFCSVEQGTVTLRFMQSCAHEGMILAAGRRPPPVIAALLMRLTLLMLLQVVVLTTQSTHQHLRAGKPEQGLEDLEPVALVIDDSSTVWALHKDSLVTVERYVYFPSSRRSLGLSSSYFEMRRCGRGGPVWEAVWP